MALPTVKMKKPESNRKKIIIIASVVAVVCLAAAGGLYVKFKGGDEDEFGGRRPRFRDANLPDVRRQSYEDVVKFKNSDKYKKLTPQEQAMYSMMSARQVMQHNMETYFTLPKEQQTAFLDKVIDEMQQNMKNMEQMRNMFPRPPRDANEPNDPNRARRMQERMAQRNNPANARSRSERGTALERAQREQFMNAMRQRMQQRGIQMPQFGGPGRPGGGRGGR
jgi:hypothetical protein